jgi:hypothetical protein
MMLEFLSIAPLATILISILMDKPTLDYYAKNAEDIAKVYEASPNALASHFASAFGVGGRILISGVDQVEILQN